MTVLERFLTNGDEDRKVPKQICWSQPQIVKATLHTSIFHSDSHAHAWLKFGSALIPSHVSSGVSV